MENETVLSVFVKKVIDENLGMIVVFDDEGSIIYLNEAMKNEVEYADGEVDIRKIFVSLIPEDMTIPAFMERQGHETAETVVYRKNNTCFSAHVSYTHKRDHETVL
ncbi:MAG: PAS domain-containing protein, partial [Lachnospiraceae bacterium]|nr:PAS domain-containing protein [Lachnospiraceae bacterium]